MTWYPIAFLPPQYDDSAGVPYSGAVLKAYEEGTSNVIAMATGYTGVTTATSFALNAAGYPVSGSTIIIPHLQENYDLALYPDQASADANSGALWTVPNIQIAETTNVAFVQSFSGDGTTTGFTLSSDLGTDENTVMIFADTLDEYSTNGDFATDSDWTKGAGWTIGSGIATAAGAISTSLEQDAAITLIEGESYTVTVTVTRSAGSVTPNIGGTAGTARSSAGTFTETIIAGSTQKLTFSTSGFTGTLDDVSVHRVNSAIRRVLSPTEFTLANTSLTIPVAPGSGTGNIIVFAPSLLFGAVGAAAAAAATSETNAATSETNAAASETAAATSETNAATSETNAATSETNAATSETNAAASEAAAKASADILSYTFSSTTTMADPGTGVVRFNHATLASVTAIAFDATTADTGNPDVSDFIDTFDASSSANKGQLTVRKSGTPATFAIFDVTAVTDNTGWLQLTVSLADSNGTLSDTDALLFSFVRTGDQGGGGTMSNLVEDITPQLGGFLDPNSNYVGRAKGGDIASASPLVVDTDGDFFDITGTTGFSSVTVGANRSGVFQFDGALTITVGSGITLNNAAANYTTSAGDIMVWQSTATNTIRGWIVKADGTALVSGGASAGIPLASYSASSDALVSVGSGLDVDAAIDGTYHSYILRGRNVRANDGANIYARTSSDGGATNDSGGSDYKYGGWAIDNSTSLSGRFAATAAQVLISLDGGVGNASSEGMNFDLILFAPSETGRYTQLSWASTHITSSAGLAKVDGSAFRISAADVDALAVLASAGNITGEFYLEGVLSA